jgi:hypothetical protein
MGIEDNCAMGILSRAEFEIDCIREFAHSGTQMGPTVSREGRRERVRAAIFREGKQQAHWRDSNLTYAAAYQQAYSQPLQARHDDPVGQPPLAPWSAAAALDLEEEADNTTDDVADGSVSNEP